MVKCGEHRRSPLPECRRPIAMKDPAVPPRVKRPRRLPAPQRGCRLRRRPGCQETLIGFSASKSDFCSCCGAGKEQGVPGSARNRVSPRGSSSGCWVALLGSDHHHWEHHVPVGSLVFLPAQEIWSTLSRKPWQQAAAPLHAGLQSIAPTSLLKSLCKREAGL